MAQTKQWRRLASFLKRYPRLMLPPYHLYRLIQPRYSIGVVGIIFNEQDEVLLVEHVFHPTSPWGLPGGWIGRNESPQTAVQRELQEELAIHITVGQVILMDSTKHQHLDIAYLCTSQDSVGELSYELLDYGWYARDALPPLQPFQYSAIQRAYERKETPIWDV